MQDELDPLSEALRIYTRHRAAPACSDEELLQRHANLAEVLGPLLERDPAPRDSEASPETRIGGYRLIERLGVGGMGEVWRAEQLDLQREVALKLLRGQRFAATQALERFRREALAGARLRHPDIVAVYAVGEAGGAHFIAQELVESGRTLATWLAEQRDQPNTTPDHWRRTAELFARAAEALAHAHDQGVIHRDLKPSNILLAADGSPKIADFGIALVHGELELSRSGDLTGSPFYMSPEQAAARREEIDARSDVFSLGCVLYEALSFARAFDGDTITQVLNKILSYDPPDPRLLRSMCPRDLAVICLKMLEKERARRYPTMSEVAADLRRFLNNEPIHARPSGLATRALKWTRRHPVLAASGTILAASSIALFLSRERALAAERIAQEQTSIAQAQSTLAEQRLLETQAQRETAELKVSQLREVNAYLTDVFAATDPARARGREPTARDLLEYGLKQLETSLVDQPLVRASLYDSIGRTFLSLGVEARAQEILDRAHALRLAAGGEESLEVADSLAALAALDTRLSKPEARERAKQALEMRLRLEAEHCEPTVSCFLTYANALSSNGELTAAIEVLQRGRDYAADFPVDNRPSRAILAATLARTLSSADELASAIELADEAIALRREISDEPHPLVAGVLGVKLAAQSRLKRFDEARLTLAESLALEERLTGPTSERYATLLVNGSGILRDSGDVDGEYAELNRALELLEAAAGPTNANVLAARERRVVNDLRRGAFAATVADSQVLLDALASVNSTASERGLLAAFCMALANDALGEHELAIAQARNALAPAEGPLSENAKDRRMQLRCALVIWLLRDIDVNALDPQLVQDLHADSELDLATSRGQWLALARGTEALARGDNASAVEVLTPLAEVASGESRAWFVPALARARLAEALGANESERASQLAARALVELEAYFGERHAETARCRAGLERLRATK